MPHRYKNQALTGLNASGVLPVFVMAENCTGLNAYLKTTAVSGGTPTLNVLLQNGMRMADGTVDFYDRASFIQLIAVGKAILTARASDDTSVAATDGTLAAGTVLNGPFGRIWRAKYVISGSTPVFTGELVWEFT